MKTLLATVLGFMLALASTSTYAHGGHGAHHGHPHNIHKHRYLYGHRHHVPVIIHRQNDNWVAPLVGGVILGAVIADANAKEKEKETQVLIQQPKSVTSVVCTEWKEIMTSDGKVYKERNCSQN